MPYDDNNSNHRTLRFAKESELTPVLQKLEVLFQTHVNGLGAFRSGRWPILGHEKLARNHPLPAFRGGDWSIFWMVGGYVASTEEAMQAEPMVCWNPETIEARIMSDHPEILAEVEELNCQHFGDSYLKIIQYPAELQKLYLRAAVSDAGMKHLARCTNLKSSTCCPSPFRMPACVTLPS